jgi:hypothetical protein
LVTDYQSLATVHSPLFPQRMSWVTVIWSMVASVCPTLAVMHLLLWCRKRTAWTNLVFALTAGATAPFPLCELRMMRVDPPGEFATALRWAHVPMRRVIVSLVAVGRLYLRAGRPLLAWAVGPETHVPGRFFLSFLCFSCST